MLNLEYLDPKDVLAHLNSLGYYNITPQQLKEFLHDLKKLIKYEQKRTCISCIGTKSSYIYPSECECSCREYDDNSDTLSSNEFYHKSSDSSCSNYTSCTGNNLKYNKTNKHGTKTSTEGDLAETAHTSFIRPWNIQVYKDLSSRGKKNLDPVRLYHQYMKFWKKQNIPGETKHAQLRWNIRNRMLGQEPQPKVFISNYKSF